MDVPRARFLPSVVPAMAKRRHRLHGVVATDSVVARAACSSAFHLALLGQPAHKAGRQIGCGCSFSWRVSGARPVCPVRRKPGGGARLVASGQSVGAVLCAYDWLSAKAPGTQEITPNSKRGEPSMLVPKPKPPSPGSVGGDAAQDAKALPPVLGTLSGNREPGVSGEHAACARSHTHPFLGLEVAPRRARRLVVPTGAAGPGRDCCKD